MTFYWHEMISKTSLKINRFLGRGRVAFFIVIGLLFAIEIVTGPFRKPGMLTNNMWTELAYLYLTTEYDIATTILVVGVVYGTVAVFVAAFYWITGARVIAYLSKRSRANNDLTLIMLRRVSFDSLTRVIV